MKNYQIRAAGILKSPIILFTLFSLCVNSCAESQIQSDFYLGLNDRAHTSHFEKALSDSNKYVRQAAAEELANLIAAGRVFPARTIRRIRQEVSGWWAAAFQAIDNPSSEKAVSLFLDFDQAAIPNAGRAYVLQEFAGKGVTLTESELAAIDGHSAVSALRYGEALRFFRVFQEDGNWPQQMPQIFLSHHVLINDLGRAFQYTSSGTEGLTLFLQWESNLLDNMAANTQLPVIKAENPDDIRYRLLFFAARIARRNGLNSQAAELFEQALLLAPDSEQSDACIWYILDSLLNENFDIFIDKLEQIAEYSQGGRNFDEVLERLLQRLVSGRQWKDIIRVYNLLHENPASIKAAYAWVIARAIEEGYLSNEEMRLAADAAGLYWPGAANFYTIAYNATENNISSFLYYRSLSADVLGLPFLEFPEEAADRQNNNTPAVQFILGFFIHDAQEHSWRYIRRLEQELSAGELRVAANALEQAGMYAQSMQLVNRYINREDYIPNRRDMELLFPRAYTDLVEKHAAGFGFAPEVLFGLIRTESAFQSSVVSHAGAIGLTQLMPATAREMAIRIRRTGGPDYTASGIGLDMNDPDQNIYIGTYYLDYLMGRFEGDLMLSLLAYNGGMNRVRRWRAASTLPVDLFVETVPIYETRDYGRKVMAAAEVYKELYYRQ